MSSICGADCAGCSFRDGCRDCCETGDRPFGGGCPAAEYIKVGGSGAYRIFKENLTDEVNELLAANGILPHGRAL